MLQGADWLDRPCGLYLHFRFRSIRPVRSLMGTWATWTFTRFERVKVRVYSTCEQGFGSLPHTGYNVAYFPAMEDGHEAKQGGERHSTV